MSILRRTHSLCPECLRLVDAGYVSDGEVVYLKKNCPEHGEFKIPAWLEKEGMPSFFSWKNNTPPSYPQLPVTNSEKGCPLDCGLCPGHAQRTCCSLVEVTGRCNMNCPVCYASAGEAEPARGGAGEGETGGNNGRRPVLKSSDPAMREIEERLAALLKHAGPANVQLSGGEPTVRDDLPEIIRLVHSMGFPFVQLNTNGLRLGREPGYARLLKEAGLDLAYLQWDGVSEKTFKTLRGGFYLQDKENAVRNCVEAGLSVLFVATVVRGVNDGELGELLQKALSFGPSVRGLHLQPAASFGRHPWKGFSAPRLTLPELMLMLETQSGGMIKAADFHPPNSEHELCSFSALYQREGDGTLKCLPGEQSRCCEPHGEAGRARDFVAKHWGPVAPEPARQSRADGFDAFLAKSALRRRFTLSAMAFQDAYSLDLERVRRCHIHVVTGEKRLVPFCMYNITSSEGIPLYRKN